MATTKRWNIQLISKSIWYCIWIF